MLNIFVTSLLITLLVLYKPLLSISVHKQSKKLCVPLSNTLRARHKVCFLRPDTGPCRADIIQWYFDAKQIRCFRFFWGGCQGNGNRFETHDDCAEHCYLNDTIARQAHLPYFCDLAFDYGTCFGHYDRWYFDSIFRTCKRRIYSGCGGNQNNFETMEECLSTCVFPPNNTFSMTTCVPIIEQHDV